MTPACAKCANPKECREFLMKDVVCVSRGHLPLRYRWDQDDDDAAPYGLMVGPVPDGAWVKWDDVKHLFDAPASPSQAEGSAGLPSHTEGGKGEQQHVAESWDDEWLGGPVTDWLEDSHAEGGEAEALIPFGWLFEGPEGLRQFSKACDFTKPVLDLHRNMAQKQPEKYTLTALYAAAPASPSQAEGSAVLPSHTEGGKGEKAHD